MTREKEKAKNIYKFCVNSHYYETLVQYVNDNNAEVKKEENCNNIIVDNLLHENVSTEVICKEFKYLHKSFGKYHDKEIFPKGTFTDYDCNFLNYWLNDKLRKKVSDGTNHIKFFYEQIKEKEKTFYCDNNEMEEYMHVIDPEILENMKILYELYHTKQKILDIMLKQDNSNSGKELCPQYTKKCHETYIEGVYKCLNGYEDFCKELKYFEEGYKYLTKEKTDESGHCKVSEYFLLPDYGSVLEKQRRILTIKILSSPLIMSFVIPLLYKYTPFGPFLRAKTKMIKNRWMNPDKNKRELLLSSTDIEDNISDNGEYNIGYYSGTD
ncbi:PIR protein [Plasmodium ovale]|uniref:PIR Superfamily Protein n=2 Tax=Plasmodium ovale TaxID=36330 RepID=A0A1A8WKJ9_PLAOA|nr:PIR Superfamily Protein [Plasmodium ovale curtisi]SBT83530.1 PIR protein [Plasmodium ovale]